MAPLACVVDCNARKRQINVTNHAAVMPLTVAAAFCYLLPQIRQAGISAVALNQILFSVLPRASTFLTGEPNHVAWIFEQLKRAIHRCGLYGVAEAGFSLKFFTWLYISRQAASSV